MMPTRESWGRRDTAIALGLFLLPVLVFWPLWGLAGPRHYFPDGDFVDQFYAFAQHAVRELAEGRWPLWNPFAYGGAPFWGDIQSGMAYPPNLALFLASARLWGRLPFGLLEVDAVLHVGLAGALTFLFARRRLGDRSAATMAALSFAFGGYVTGYPMLQLAILHGVAWLPLVLWAVDRSAERGLDGRPWRAALRPDPWAALALALVVTAGHPQSALMVGYIGLAFAVWRAWAGHGGWPSAGRALVAYATSGALALLLSAAAWLPALDFMRRSTRAEADFGMLAGGFAPRELLGAALPGLTHWSPLYVGILPLLLGLAAGWALLGDASAGTPRAGGAGRSELAFWIGLSLTALLLSLGRRAFAFDIAYLLAPGFDLFRGQERAALAVSFGLAMLAGWALAEWRAGRMDIGPGLARLGLLAVGLGALAAIAAPPDLRAAAARLCLLGLAATVLAWAWSAKAVGPGVLATVVLAITLADLAIAVGHVNLRAEAPSELAGGPLVGALRERGPQRIDNQDRVPPNFGVLHGLEATSGASPLRLTTTESLRLGLAGRPDRWRELLVVSHVLSWQGELESPAERVLVMGTEEDPSILYQLGQAGPWAWWAAVAEWPETQEAALARLREDSFSVFSAVLLEGPAPAGNLPAPSATGLDLVDRRPGLARVRTQSETPGWVVFSEVHDPGWEGRVDGRPADVLRADVALMAVAVPAGEHEVGLDYTAPWVRRGVAGSVIGLLALAALAWRTGRHPRITTGRS